tara:strand:- start:281 stop:490 length:210 start_codon:yes stop_codon:yes gene_type:complete
MLSQAIVYGHEGAKDFGKVLSRAGIAFKVEQHKDRFTFYGTKKGDKGGAGSSAVGKNDELFPMSDGVSE